MRKKLSNDFLTKNRYSLGQVALIVLAMMGVILTIAVSLSQKVVGDIQQTKRQEESAKAFFGAEAGLEEALRRVGSGENPADIPTNELAEDLGIDELGIESVAVGGNSSTYSYPVSVNSGEEAIIWLRDHNGDGSLNEGSGYSGSNLNFCWEQGAAVELIYFYRDGSNYRIEKSAYDTEDIRRASNNFAEEQLGSCAGLSAGASVNLAGTPLFLIARIYYQQTRIAVSGDSNFPSQGVEIVSSGSVSRGETKVSRRIKAYRGYNILPPPFSTSLYSGTSISGN